MKRILLAASLAAVGGCSLIQAGGKPDITPVERVSDSRSGERAEALLAGGKPRQAAATYRAILAAEPDNAEARYGLAEALRQDGQAEAAKGEYIKAAENPDWRVRALEGLGLANLATGDQNGAFEALSTATTEDASAWRAWLGLAQLRDLARDWAQADEAYAAALSATDRPAIVLNNQGISMLARGDSAAAERLFASALAADPSFERAALNLDLAKAVTAGTPLADLASAEPDAKKRAQKLNNFGYVAMLQGRFDEAEKLFQAAVEAHPSYYPIAFENLKTLNALRAEAATKTKGSERP